MYAYPKSTLGKVSFWLAVAAFSLLYVQYWVAMMATISIPIFSGILVIVVILASGVCAVIAMTAYKDKAWLLFLPMTIGLFGVALVVGELVFPH